VREAYAVTASAPKCGVALAKPSNHSANVLVIDDDPMASVVVRQALDGSDVRVASHLTGEEGIEYALAELPDVIVLDHLLPDTSGTEVLARLQRDAPTCPVVFVTSDKTGGTAIEAMKLGAFDYLTKPFELPRLRSLVERALRLSSTLRTPVQKLSAIEPFGGPLGELVGECPAMQTVFKAIGTVAMHNVSVLLAGEQGTGKETVAQAIHDNSRTPGGPFVKLHCPSYDPDQLEQQLFGEVPLDSAVRNRGRLAQAHGGTLLLEEVGSLPLPTQGRLLNVLREGVIESETGGSPTPIDFRMIASTSTELEGLVRAGVLRSDLYYVLSSFVIRLPPLRQRAGDLPLLIEQLLPNLSAIDTPDDATPLVITDESLQLLCGHTWPGNIDELQSVLRRASVESKSRVALPETFVKAIGRDPVVSHDTDEYASVYSTDWDTFAKHRIERGADSLYQEATLETDRKLLARVLEHTEGNQAHAARILGITRTSLRKKLRQAQLVVQQKITTQGGAGG